MARSDAGITVFCFAVVAIVWSIISQLHPQASESLYGSLTSVSITVFLVFFVSGALIALRYNWLGFFGITLVAITALSLLMAFNEAIDPGDSGPFLGTFWGSVIVILTVSSCGVIGFWFSRLLRSYLGSKNKGSGNA
jgi:uncharacterized membrane protein